MKSLLALGILFFALGFCGLGERLQGITGDDGDSGDTTTTDSGDTTGDSSDEDVKAAELTSDMEGLLDGDKAVWEDQGITFKLPKGWPKMSVSKNSFQYGSPAKGFLIVTLSSLPNFNEQTQAISLKGTYDQQVAKAKDGGNEKVQWTMLDGVKGVEFVEAKQEDAGDPRRHQFIGYRKYNDQTQMVNVMVSTKSSNFDKNKEIYNAILYSMTMAKQ
ncbi:MAG: hypothetical protein HKN33_03515 [Pyrinomonadaceae bacterium]|nr:hypothetical protein [Pyrinomonadaceae bacterium]